MNNVISVKNLTKKYKKLTAIDNLSFDVHEGEILGLLGPNGSGKSTTINCLLSLLNFEQGTIKIFNKEMTPESYDIKRNIGVIFQEVAVFDELTIYENIDYFCGLYITDKNKRAAYIEDAIKLVGLEEFKKFYPKQLSGGLLRRLNIACGIAHKPKLIFLDEPTVAVDPQSRNNILDGIKELRDAGATILYTTHYMEEVELLCDRIIILDKGKIIAQGTTEELKDLAKIEEKITVEVENVTDETLEKIRPLFLRRVFSEYLKLWKNISLLIPFQLILGKRHLALVFLRKFYCRLLCFLLGSQLVFLDCYCLFYK